MGTADPDWLKAIPCDVMVSNKTGLEEEAGNLWLSGWTLIGYCLGMALHMGSDDWLHLLCLMGERGLSLSVLQCIYFHPWVFLFSSYFLPCPNVGRGVSQYQCGCLANGWSRPTTKSKVWLRKAWTWGFEWKHSGFEQRFAVSVVPRRLPRRNSWLRWWGRCSEKWLQTCSVWNGSVPRRSGAEWRRRGEALPWLWGRVGWLHPTWGQLLPAWVPVPLLKHSVFLPQWQNSLALNSPGIVQARFPSGDLLFSILVASEPWWKWWVGISGSFIYPELPASEDTHLLYAGAFPSEWAACL